MHSPGFLYIYKRYAYFRPYGYGCSETIIRTDALEKVGGSSLVIKEGGISAFAAFTVTWIITFTVINS